MQRRPRLYRVFPPQLQRRSAPFPIWKKRGLAALLWMAGSAASCLAAKPVTVEHLQQLLAAANGKPDAKIAQQLSEVQLTERLSAARLSDLESGLPGPQSRRALLLLAGLSAFRNLPPAEIPSMPPPEIDSQRTMIARATDYTAKTITRLPNFFAVRDTVRFQNTPQGNEQGTSLVPYQPLRAVGTSTVSVVYRDGREMLDSGAARDGKTPSAAQGLNTRGEFGPILGAVLVDAAQEGLTWSHWEQRTNGLQAVFSYSIPQAKSHYQVEFCCVPGKIPNGLFQQFSGYHGSIAIDPANGSVLRLVLQADLKSSDPVLRSDIMVEYGSVQIGGNSYICPIKSVSILVSPPLDRRGYVTENYVGVAANGDTASEHLQVWLNEVVFEQYHIFGSHSHVVTAAKDEAPAAAQPSPEASPAPPGSVPAPSLPPQP